jgi:hypothetical protein
LISAVTAFIKDHPGLTALIVFIVLAIDTLYIYRTWKRFRKRPHSTVQATGSSKHHHSGPAQGHDI